MKDSSCLGVSHGSINGIADYYPTSLKQAKAQLRAECKGKTSTTQLLGLLFRFDNHIVSREDVLKFDEYCARICNDKLKQWNKVKKK